MRILQVTTIPETLEAFLRPFASHFRGLGWTVDAAARGVTKSTADLGVFSAIHDISWSRNPLHPTNVRAYREVRSLLNQQRYDLVHVHTPVASFVARWAASRSRTRPAVVYTAHGFHFHAGGNPALNHAFAAAERIAGPWTDELVVINSTDYSAALKLRLVPPERLTLVPGIGFDSSAFLATTDSALSRADVLTEIGLPSTARVVLMVAEFTPNKRQLDAVEAFARLADARTHLLFVGVGPTMQSVRARVQELGLGGSVHFLGYRRDVSRLMAVAQALLLLSEREGLPRSVMEGMAVGVPVIGTDIRGVSDLLGDGGGVLVPVADVAAITVALADTLRAGPDVIRRITTAKSRLEAYSLDSVLAGYEEIYSRALESRRA